MNAGEKLRFDAPNSPNDGLLVEFIDEPGYDINRDEINAEYANVRILEGKNAGLVCGIRKTCLKVAA